MPKTEDEAPLTVEDILCVKGGRLGTKVVKVPIEYEDIDGVKIRIFRVRKRDCWLISPFINQTTASAKEKEVISATLVEIQAGFHKAILEKRRKQRAKIGEAEEAAEGRAAVGLSSDEDEGSGSDSGIEVPAGDTAADTKSKTTTRQGKHRKLSAAERMEPLRLETIFVERDTDYTEFRIIEPCNVRGFRVEATRESVLNALSIANEIMKRAKTEEEARKPKKTESWKQKAAEEEPDDHSMEAKRGIIGWNPSRKAWAIFYKADEGKEAKRLIKEFRVKSPREGGRKRFLDGKAETYKTACQQWNTLDKSKRPRLEV